MNSSMPFSIAAPENAYRCRLVEDSLAFLHLQRDWEQLRRACPDCPPFLSWAWHYTWWQVYADKHCHLSVLCLYHADQLIAVAPFYRHRPHYTSGYLLRFIGTGERGHEAVVSEYLDILIHPKHRLTALPRLASQLLQLSPSWERAEFPNVLPGSALERLEHYLLPHINRQTVRRGQRFRVALPDSLEHYLARLKPSQQKRIARNQRRLQRLGEVDFSWHEPEGEACEAALQQLTHMHKARWHPRLGGVSVFDSAKFLRFHDLLLSRLRRREEAAIRTLSINGEPLATLYCFYTEHTCFYYQSGFYRQHANHLSPLQLAHIFEMRKSIESGRRYYDFMRGDDGSYKQDYAPETTPMYDRYWFRSARLRHWFEAKRLLKKGVKSLLRSWS